MGLGIQTRAQLRRGGKFGLFSTVVSPEEIADAFCACARGTPLEDLASKAALPDAGGYAVVLHPAAEAVFIETDGTHAKVSAKTSNAGPGYHAFLVTVLDSVGKSLGLNWEWDQDEAGENLDETGFFHERDFEKLKGHIAWNVRAVFASAAQHMVACRSESFGVWMPVSFDIGSIPDNIITPFGPISVAEGQRLGALPDEELLQSIAGLLPWWEKDFDGGFYRGLTLFSMWMDLRWCDPLDDGERHSIERTLRWAAEAGRLGAVPPIPREAVDELNSLLSPDPGDFSNGRDFPGREGIGYRRRTTRVSLPGGWQVSVPGSLAETTEDEGETLVFWNSVLVIRASCWSAVREDGTADDGGAGPTDEIQFDAEFGPLDGGFGLLVSAEAESRRGTRKICRLTTWMRHESLRGMCEDIVRTLTYRDPRAA
jgi:hypothetical protein